MAYPNFKAQTCIGLEFSSRRVKDSNGYLHFEEAPVFRSGVVEVAGIELQAFTARPLDYGKKYTLMIPPEELEKAKMNFAKKPVTWGHKWLGKKGAHGDFIGYTAGNAEMKGDLLCTDLSIADVDSVAKIEMGEREELSSGVEFVLAEGRTTDFVMSEIDCNHIAVVRKGKAGARVRLPFEDEVIKPEDTAPAAGEKPVEAKDDAPADKPADKPAENPEKTTEKPETAPEEKVVEKEQVKVEEIKKDEPDAPPKEEPVKEDVAPEAPAPAKQEKVSEPEKTPVQPAVQGENASEKKTPEPEKAFFTPNITGIEHADNPSDIEGKTVELSFEEGGFYEVKDGHPCRIDFEAAVASAVDERIDELGEAFSICKQIDNSVSLRKDALSMYRPIARLVFGKVDESDDAEVLKHRLQGFLMGRGAKLSSGNEKEKDIRTIEI